MAPNQPQSNGQQAETRIDLDRQGEPAAAGTADSAGGPCEWGHDDYSLQVENLPEAPPKAGQQEMEL
jgi:hypothetical protein